VLDTDLDIDNLIYKEEFTHHYQEVFLINSMQKIGVEFLFRGMVGNPEFIFQKAREASRLYDLDTKSIRKAFTSNFSKKKGLIQGLLFLNIYPSTILNPNFPNFIKKLSNSFPNSCKDTVFEIIESEKTSNLNLLKSKVLSLKEKGFKIAIDDVGKGWSSLSTIIELRPDFIKLDRYFSINLSMDNCKQKMIKLLIDYCHDTKSKVILEGIETTKDLDTARKLGIQLCQGYLLSRPQPVI
jgi:EAL domain-containing protein (putative c-di-GMP-specific phosphodiesterase class I)